MRKQTFPVHRENSCKSQIQIDTSHEDSYNQSRPLVSLVDALYARSNSRATFSLHREKYQDDMR